MAKPPQHFSLDSTRIAEFLEFWGAGGTKHEVKPDTETRQQRTEVSRESEVDGLVEGNHDEQ